jgi:hypothetical protein
VAPEWLDIARNHAEERYRSLPLPTAKDEAFRFTPVSDLEQAAAQDGATPVAAELSALDGEEAALLLLNGEEASRQGAPASARATYFPKINSRS